MFHKIDLAFKALALNKKVQGRNLCLIGLPFSIFPSSVAQGIWLKKINNKLPIYHAKRSCIGGNVFNKNNRIKFTSIKNGLRIILENHTKISFITWRGANYEMGTIQINKSKNNKIVDISFIFDKKYIE
ncbi:MAG: hypothetical protein ACTSUG_00545 [Candidatus Helarchaeota archaeon]